MTFGTHASTQLTCGGRVCLRTGDGFPWYKHFAADSLHQTRFLTAEQLGWLTRLENECWLSETRGSISRDPEKLWRIAGAKSRKRFEASCGPVIAFFTDQAGKLQSKRLRAQAVNSQYQSKVRSIAGKRGAESTKLRYFTPSGGNGHGRTEQEQNRYRAAEIECDKEERSKASHFREKTEIHTSPRACEILKSSAERRSLGIYIRGGQPADSGSRTSAVR